MSGILGLLATGAGAGTSLPPDPPSPPTTVREAIVLQLDPANYGGRVFTVGTDHATIAGCLALADAASSEGVWSLVRIPPGTYAERIVRQHGTGWTDIASTTLDPADVTLDPPDDTDDTLEHYGTGGIVAGITFKGKGSKSAVHSGEFHPTRDYEFIYYNVVGRQEGSGNDAFSWGVGPGQSVFAYDCQWRGVGGTGRAAYVHNFSAPARAGNASLVFDGCDLIGSPGMSLMEWGSGDPDVVYINGGSGSISNAYNNYAGPGCWAGAVDPDLTFSTNVSPSYITRTMPTNPSGHLDLPTPARLAAWLP